MYTGTKYGVCTMTNKRPAEEKKVTKHLNDDKEIKTKKLIKTFYIIFVVIVVFVSYLRYDIPVIVNII